MKRIIVLMFACLLYANITLADGMAEIWLQWNLNSEPDVVNQSEAGYKLYYTDSNGLETIIDAGNTNYDLSVNPQQVMQYKVKGLKTGEKYTLYITCYDTSKNESDPSDSITATAKNVEAPEKPIGLIEQ